MLTIKYEKTLVCETTLNIGDTVGYDEHGEWFTKKGIVSYIGGEKSILIDDTFLISLSQIRTINGEIIK